MSAQGLLVIGHGSRREEANETVRAVARALAERGSWAGVQAAFLDVVQPDIATGYARLVAAGCARVVAHPFFLFPGDHTTRDIPAALREAQRRHPGATWTVTAPLGLHPGVLSAAQGRIDDALAVNGAPPTCPSP